MQKIKDESGITLVMLTITIIVMLILVAVTVTIGTENVQTSIDQNDFASLSVVQQAVLTQYKQADVLGELNRKVTVLDYTNKPTSFPGTMLVSTTSIEADGISWEITDFNYYEDYYYRLTPTQLSEIGISNSDSTYVVNYKTGEVYNETKKITSVGEKLYVKSTNNSTEDDEVDTTFSED